MCTDGGRSSGGMIIGVSRDVRNGGRVKMILVSNDSNSCPRNISVSSVGTRSENFLLISVSEGLDILLSPTIFVSKFVSKIPRIRQVANAITNPPPI